MDFVSRVSVPLRGKYRGEAFKSEGKQQTQFDDVSVPLRGKYRGEVLKEEAVGINPTYLEFPSPCGVNIVAKT